MTDTLPHLRGALATRTPEHTDDIALRGIRVTTRLAAMGERTRIELTFANRGSHPIEPIYTFPLPDGAAWRSVHSPSKVLPAASVTAPGAPEIDSTNRSDVSGAASGSVTMSVPAEP